MFYYFALLEKENRCTRKICYVLFCWYLSVFQNMELLTYFRGIFHAMQLQRLTRIKIYLFLQFCHPRCIFAILYQSSVKGDNTIERCNIINSLCCVKESGKFYIRLGYFLGMKFLTDFYSHFSVSVTKTGLSYLTTPLYCPQR